VRDTARALFLLLLLAAPACCQQAELPAADDLIAKMVWRARQETKANAPHDYGFKARIVTDRFKDDGGLKARHEFQLETVLIENEPYNRLVSKDGQPLSEKDRAAEAKRQRQFRERLHAKRPASETPPLIDESLMRRFRVQVVRLDEVDGHPAWLLTLFPKSEQPPARSRDEKVLGRMQGKIWIDAVRFSLVRGELDLAEPVGLGMGASVREVHLEFESEMIAPSVWMMRHSTLKLTARGLFDSARVQWNTDYSDYHSLFH
jgi:hypothetical protein